MSNSSTRPPAMPRIAQKMRICRFYAVRKASFVELAQRVVERRERCATGNEVGVTERVEGSVDGFLRIVHVARIGVRVEESGDDLAHGVTLLQVVHRGDLVRRI